MSLREIKSQRGHTLLVLNNFKFNKYRELSCGESQWETWKCTIAMAIHIALKRVWPLPVPCAQICRLSDGEVRHAGVQFPPTRTFVSRALFAADSIESVKNVLKCGGGGGIADAMSLNLIFFGSTTNDSLFYNVEVGPSYPTMRESAVSVVALCQGQNLFHANRFLHLKTPELDPSHPMVQSSVDRHCRKEQVPDPRTRMELLSLMGDTENDSVNIFRDRRTEDIWTIAVGVFNISAKTWSVYIGNPKNSDPLIELPLR